MKTEIIDSLITTDKILFFDLDGTLVDTNRANFLAYNKAVKFVTSSTIDLNYNPNKRFNRGVLKTSFPNLTVHEYEKIIQEKENFFAEFLNEMTLIIENVNVLNRYSQTNRTFLVTNCRKDRALVTLNHFELTSKFERIFYREFDNSTERVNKFQNAISILGIPPSLIFAFENEEIEIIDAIEAGIKIINPKIFFK
jgi:beta-phosphoglucomutase